MVVKQIVAELDQEILRLREARQLLAGASPNGNRRGRPAKSLRIVSKRKKHNLSAAGRKRISEALKRRWAAHRKAAKKAA